MKIISQVLNSAPPFKKANLAIFTAKQLSLLLVAFILYSICAASSHQHADLKNSASCIICKTAHDLSGSDQTNLLLLIAPQVLKTYFAFEDSSHYQRIVVSTTSSRGPPVSQPSPNSSSSEDGF